MCFFKKKSTATNKSTTTNNSEEDFYISELTFNDNTKIALDKNDIVVFVGANNVGKSQALNDIYNILKAPQKGIIINSLELKKGNIKKHLDSYFDKKKISVDFGIKPIKTYIIPQTLDPITDISIPNDSENYYGPCCNAFVANINTESRLSVCQPQNIESQASEKKHPQHFFYKNKEQKIFLTNNFYKAFGNYIHVDYYNAGKIDLRIGEKIEFDSKTNENSVELYTQQLNNYPKVYEQGDGIKSFVGILSFLALDFYKTFLIDEPEAFLHQPQAQIIGKIIGESLKKDQQAFISTHSENFLLGLLEASPNRVKIIRITRSEKNNTFNTFTILNNAKIKNVWSDPLLKFSNILQSIFHKTVILCESDSDCKMYSIIENHIKSKSRSLPETLYIQCGGKARMPAVIEALLALKIDLKVIPDIDLFNNFDLLLNVVNKFGIQKKDIEKDYNIVATQLNNAKYNINKNTIKKILDKNSDEILSEETIKQIKESLKKENKWDSIKKYGITATPQGTATEAFNRLLELFKQNNIFIVPVGELECFIRECGGHGPKWVNNVLESYPNFDDPVYNDIKNFVLSWNT